MAARTESFRLVRSEDLYVRERGVMHHSEKQQLVYWLCPCGCDGVVGITVAPGGWTMAEEDGVPTISPSILHHNCGAHYFIRGGRVEWCG